MSQGCESARIGRHGQRYPCLKDPDHDGKHRYDTWPELIAFNAGPPLLLAILAFHVWQIARIVLG